MTIVWLHYAMEKPINTTLLTEKDLIFTYKVTMENQWLSSIGKSVLYTHINQTQERSMTDIHVILTENL
ncbi:hypothetical protein AYI73_01020 [Shewanella algae]|nr:hypothetical protein AYI73_01020 [Shewanella algae]